MRLLFLIAISCLLYGSVWSSGIRGSHSNRVDNVDDVLSAVGQFIMAIDTSTQLFYLDVPKALDAVQDAFEAGLTSRHHVNLDRFKSKNMRHFQEAFGYANGEVVMKLALFAYKQSLVESATDRFMNANITGNHFVKQINLLKVPAIREHMITNEFLNLTTFPRSWVNAIPDYIKGYINHSDMKIRRSMVARVVQVGVKKHFGDYISGLVLGAGPAFQKFFQSMADIAFDKKVRKSLQVVKSKIPPMRKEEFEAVLGEIFENGDPLSEDFEYFETNSLAAGTVGQVHRARLKEDSPLVAKFNGEVRDVVLKILRPTAGELLAMEADIYPTILGNHSYVLRQMMGVIISIKEEMDFGIEAENIRNGMQYEDRRRGVRVARVVKLYAGRTQKETILALASEFAPGKSLENLWEKYHSMNMEPKADNEYGIFVCTASKKLELLYQTLINTAFFGSGFYHGDLHGGNIKIDTTGPPSQWTMWIIDFGNAGILTKDEQKTYFDVGNYVYFRNLRAIVRTVKDSARKQDRYDEASPEEWKGFEHMTEEILNNIPGRFYQVAGSIIETQKATKKILSDANKFSIPIWPGIVKLYRSIFSLEKDMEKFPAAVNHEECRVCRRRFPTPEELILNKMVQTVSSTTADRIKSYLGWRQTCPVPGN
jgi:predicted unusual protein kinase regulating ubiquinone biosynthesis (AarF/ABC1/UbiB family)